MKKILFAIAIVMMMGVTANAQDSFFKWNDASNEINRTIEDNADPFALPVYHGAENDPDAPLGSGLVILTALGAGYAVYRKKRNM